MALWVLVGVAAGCTARPGGLPRSTADEVVVYAATLRWMGYGPEYEQCAVPTGCYLVLYADTVQGTVRGSADNENWQYVKAQLPALSDETINDYADLNAGTARLPADADLGTSYRLLTQDDSRGIEELVVPDEDPWSAFDTYYPGARGLVGLSRVGFSANGDQALLFRTIRCGSLCGGFGFVLLEKRGNTWQVTGESQEAVI